MRGNKSKFASDTFESKMRDLGGSLPTTNVVASEAPRRRRSLLFTGKHARAIGEDEQVTAAPPFVSVAAGARHSVAVAGDGRVFVFGSNEIGECGPLKPADDSDAPWDAAYDCEDVLVPREPAWHQFSGHTDRDLHHTGGLHVARVAAGDGYSVFVSTSGHVYGCGRMECEGENGEEETVNIGRPPRLTSVAIRAFELMDADGSGGVSLGEFKAFCHANLLPTTSEKWGLGLATKLEKNGSGGAHGGGHSGEHGRGRGGRRLSIDNVGVELEWLFTKIDINGNGDIERHEILEVFHDAALVKEISKACPTIRALLKDADRPDPPACFHPRIVPLQAHHHHAHHNHAHHNHAHHHGHQERAQHDPVVQVAAGSGHCLFLKQSGSVLAFGSGSHGALGNGGCGNVLAGAPHVVMNGLAIPETPREEAPADRVAAGAEAEAAAAAAAEASLPPWLRKQSKRER